MSIADMKRMAKAESAASKRAWGTGDRYALAGEKRPDRPRKDSIAEQVHALAGTGTSTRQAAAIIGCSHGYVGIACKRLGISWKTGKPLEANQ